MKYPALLRIFILVFLMMGYWNEMKGQVYVSAGVGIGYEGPFIDEPMNDRGHYSGAIGYDISKKLNIELDINNLNFGQDGNFYDNTEWYHYSFQMIRLMPLIKYKFSKSMNSFYLKGGMAIGINCQIIDNYNEFQDVATLPNPIIYNVKYYGGVSPGYVLGIGQDIHIYKSLSIFTELLMLRNIWTPNKMQIIYNNVPIHLDINEYDLAELRLSIGLKYSFGKKEKH